MNLLDLTSLERSPVVANSAMNRERGCMGGNSYARELNFNPVEFLRQRLQTQSYVTWVDLCCGTGRALIEAAELLSSERPCDNLKIVGVDLVAMFYPYPESLSFLRLEEASGSGWRPDRPLDLVTCVHGLHYVGDKLGLITRAVSWLKRDGRFLAHLDPANLRWGSGAGAGRQIIRALRERGVEYDSRRHLLSREGWGDVELGYCYLGADDAAGPNYTRQPAVDSYYSIPEGGAGQRPAPVPPGAGGCGLE